MKCADARELLSAYIDDAIDAKQRSRLEEHLRDCPTCAAELNQLRQTIALVAGLEEMEPPAEFRAALRQRLQTLEAGERSAKTIRPVAWMQTLSSLSLRNAMAAALALIITLAGGIGIGVRLAGGNRADLLATRKSAEPGVTGLATGKGGGGAEPAGGDSAGGEPKMGVAALGGTADATTPGNQADMGQKIIRFGDITVAVDDITAAQKSVTDLAVSRGGYVENSSFQQVTATSARAFIALRIPAAQLDQVAAEVSKLGLVKSSGTGATAVTAQYTDAEARLRNLRLQEESLREVLKRATTVDEILRVENELSRVRTDIDVTVATLKNLDTGIEMATLNVNLEQDPDAVAVGSDQSFWNRIKGACVNTVKAIGRALVGFAVFIGGSLPVLAILAALWLAIRPQRWFRHRQ